MVVLAFIVYALHHFFIAHWVAGAARWSASTLADMGYEHAAYYAGLGWLNNFSAAFPFQTKFGGG